MSRLPDSASLHPAQPADLPALLLLEAACFPPERRESRRGLLRSLRSDHQEIWLCREHDRPVAAMTLRLHPRTLRLYSLAVHPEYQGTGLGAALLQHAFRRATDLAVDRISLEVDAGDDRLRDWYQRHGFQPAQRLPDYYAPGHDALRMRRSAPFHPPSPTSNAHT